MKFVWILMGTTLWASVSALAADSYYVLEFAYDSKPAKIGASHTFEMFVEVSPAGEIVDQTTISWLPVRDGGKSPLAYAAPEAGKSYSLGETLGIARDTHRTITYWEPLETDAELFEKAKQRSQDLSSKPVKYVVFDRDTSRQGVALNCISAANVVKRRGFGILSGRYASRAVLEHFGPFLVDNTVTHPEILDRVMVDGSSLKELLVELHAQREDTWGLQFRPR